MVRGVNVHTRAKALADELHEAGDLTSDHWRTAVEQVWRHEFVPAYFRNEGGNPTLWRMLNSFDGAEWLDGIYKNASLVTRLDPGTSKAVDGGWTGVPASSSTAPGVMLRMLEALDPAPDHTVLEVGTGTAWNAALLAHRLDKGQFLTTADIDADLVLAARGRLKARGSKATVLACDATAHRWSTPFDRVIVTCGLPRIPETLRTAVAPGGRVVANLMGPLSAGLAVLDATSDQTLEGRFHPRGGSFMPARHDADDPVLPPAADHGTTRAGTATVPLNSIDSYPFQFLLAAHLPGLQLQYGTDNGYEIRRLVLPDGSESDASYRNGEPLTYLERGSREIWPLVERCWRWFAANDCPAWDHFGLTITPGGHLFWFEEPDQVLTRF